MKIIYKQITLFEPKKLWIFIVGWKITEEYKDWLDKEKSMMKKLVALEKVNKIKAQNIFKKIRPEMQASHHSNSQAFACRIHYSSVLDIDALNIL